MAGRTAYELKTFLLGLSLIWSKGVMEGWHSDAALGRLIKLRRSTWI